MTRSTFTATLVLLTGCLGAERQADFVRPGEASSQVELLVREGCAMSHDLEQQLAAAVDKTSGTFEIVNQEDLAPDDERRGYPTPTILVAGADLFGLPRPTSPFPAPT